MVRFTTQKRHRKKSLGGDPNAPTETEWEQMKEYGSFIVRDEDGEEHRFRKGECAIILPNGRKVGESIEMHEYWVGKIRDVRAREDNDVWTHVQWYWSPQEVRSYIKSFDDTLCSPYERVFSDNFDYVSTSAFDAVVPLYRLNDGDLLQPYIPWDSFYSRYTFELRARMISVRRSPSPSSHSSTDFPSSSSSSDPQPKPGEYSCLCKVPYAPLSLEPAVPVHFADTVKGKGKGKGKEKATATWAGKGTPPKSHTLMHYCPRPTCRRFFHAACLLAADCLDPDTDTASRRRRLLCASPDVEGEFVLARVLAKSAAHQAHEEPESELEPEPERKRIRVGTPLGESPIPTASASRGRGRGRSRGRGRGRRRGRGRGGHPSTSTSIRPASPAPSSPPPLISHTTTSPSDPSDLDPDLFDLEMRLASLPPDLVSIAEQPIVRGVAWRAGGVSGNLGAVVRARRIVYNAVLGKGWRGHSKDSRVSGEEGEERESGDGEEEDGLDGWEERVGDVERVVVDLGGVGVEVEEQEVKKRGKGRGRGRKGVKRKAGPKNGEENSEGVLPFLCPQCGGAI